jgi:hypothetical protein
MQTPYVPCSKSHVHIPSPTSFIQRIHPGLRLCMTFRNKLVFYGEGLLAQCLTPKLEDHSVSFVHCCLFSIFAATLHCWRPSLRLKPEDVPCYDDKGSHLTWCERKLEMFSSRNFLLNILDMLKGNFN